MVYRVYVEKKAGLQNQAEELKKECVNRLRPDLLEVLYRFDEKRKPRAAR